MADPAYLTQYVILIPGRCKILCIRLRVGMDQTRKLYCNSMFCNHESQTKPILSVLGFLFYGIVFQISTCQIKWVGVGSSIFFIITPTTFELLCEYKKPMLAFDNSQGSSKCYTP